MRQRFTIVVEPGPSNYSAYAPDVLGCIATGYTIERTVAQFIAALTDHLATLHEMGQPLPQPTTTTRDVITDSPADYITTVEVEMPEQASRLVSMTA